MTLGLSNVIPVAGAPLAEAQVADAVGPGIFPELLAALVEGGAPAQDAVLPYAEAPSAKGHEQTGGSGEEPAEQADVEKEEEEFLALAPAPLPPHPVPAKPFSFAFPVAAPLLPEPPENDAPLSGDTANGTPGSAQVSAEPASDTGASFEAPIRLTAIPTPKELPERVATPSGVKAKPAPEQPAEAMEIAFAAYVEPAEGSEAQRARQQAAMRPDLEQAEAAQREPVKAEHVAASHPTLQTDRVQSAQEAPEVAEPPMRRAEPAPAKAKEHAAPSSQAPLQELTAREQVRPGEAQAGPENERAPNPAPAPGLATASAESRRTGADGPKPTDHAPVQEIREVPEPREVYRPSGPPEIALRIEGGGDDRVDVRLKVHQGGVAVAVRSSDPELASTLRANLDDLVSRLESDGQRAESWVPAGEVPAAPEAAEARSDRQSDAQTPRDSQNQQQGQQQRGEDGRNRQRGSRPQWMEVFENSLESSRRRH
jgi:Predicted membrane protein